MGEDTDLIKVVTGEMVYHQVQTVDQKRQVIKLVMWT